MNSRLIISLLGLMFVVSCKSPSPREPVTQTSGHFMKNSIARNKALQARQEKAIHKIIKKDSTHQYHTSSYGFWYRYDKKITAEAYTPQTGDLVNFNYNIYTLQGHPIYTTKEIGTRLYTIDKENIISGLRHGLKLMKAGETVTFYFPSYMAFGYYGDSKKIKSNMPIRVTVTLNEIEKNTPHK